MFITMEHDKELNTLAQNGDFDTLCKFLLSDINEFKKNIAKVQVLIGRVRKIKQEAKNIAYNYEYNPEEERKEIIKKMDTEQEEIDAEYLAMQEQTYSDKEQVSRLSFAGLSFEDLKKERFEAETTYEGLVGDFTRSMKQYKIVREDCWM